MPALRLENKIMPSEKFPEIPSALRHLIALTIIATAPKSYREEAHRLYIDSLESAKLSTAIDIFIGGVSYRATKAWLRLVTIVLSIIEGNDESPRQPEGKALLHTQ